MKIKLIIVLSVLVLFVSLVLFMPHYRSPAEKTIKEDYSAEEILKILGQKFSRLHDIKVIFKDQASSLSLKNGRGSGTGRCILFHSIRDDRIKISSRGLEITKDRSTGWNASFKNNDREENFQHLIHWMAAVYRVVFSLPYELDHLASVCDITLEKMNKIGYYRIILQPGNRSFLLEMIVNMSLEVVEKVKFWQNDNSVILAKLSHFGEFDGLNFPQRVRVQYESREEKYLFQTFVKNVKVNPGLGSDQFHFKKIYFTSWYTDPLFLNNEHILLIRITGQIIHTPFDGSRIINKQYALVSRTSFSGKDNLIKLLFKVQNPAAQFFFTGDYNPVRDIVSLAISSGSDEGRGKEPCGIFLFDPKSKNIKKISEQGVFPVWSSDGDHLLWNQSSGKKGINDIYICDYKGEEGRLLIRDGFFYNWGETDKTIIFEKGYWMMARGHIIPSSLKNKDIKGGIYQYHRDTKEIKTLSPTGFFPDLSADKKKLIFSDRLDKSGIYLMDLEDKITKRIISFHESYDIPRAFWYIDKILFIKTGQESSRKQGLYLYYPAQDNFEFLSDRIFPLQISSVFFDLSSDKRYLLYKFYNLPVWDHCVWGIYDFKKNKLMHEEESIPF